MGKWVGFGGLEDLGESSGDLEESSEDLEESLEDLEEDFGENFREPA